MIVKVLLVNPHIFSGGAERVVISTARWLNKLGIKCDILTLSLELETTKEEKGIRFLLPTEEIKYSLNVSVLSTAKKILLELHRLCLSINSVIDDYDIFNPHSFPAYWAFGFVKTRNKAKVVWTCHDVLDVYGAMRETFEKNRSLGSLMKTLKTVDRCIVNKNIKAIITVSTKHAKEVIRAYGQRPFIIPPAIDVEKYAQGNGEAFREKYELSNCFLAVHVGNLIPRKSQEVSIQAIAILRSLIPNIRLAIIGDGSDKPKLRKLVSNLNLKENVIFTGKISDHELRDAYKAADVNLLPSTLESFGLTPIEALASGTVSIVSEETGVSEYLKRYGIGYVTNRNPKELARLIFHVYKNPDEVKDKVKKAQDILREKFSWKSHVQQLLKVYKKVRAEP